MAKKKKVKRRRKISTPKKEWTTRRLEKAEKILTTTQVHEPFFSQIVFWSAILVIVIGNLIMSIALIPFLTVLNKWFLDVIIVVLALVMGILFNFLITNIGHLDRHHHVLALVIVPLIALANVIFVVIMANQIIAGIEIVDIRHNPWLMGILYGVAFVLPYIFYNVRKVYK
ncbi:MAG: hypothetical protein KAT77_02535 [Nanoarchaeota archaeon]|nr:hypothetical protein [Nanoarchaeota archaeon]